MPHLRRANPSIKRVVWVSFLVDLSDVILNLFVAIASGSVVMLSETLQGIADLITSGLLLFGVRRASRRANKDYQFGYGRDLFFWVLVAAVAMFVLTGGLSFLLGLDRFLHPKPIHNGAITIVVLAIGLASNIYAFSQSFRRLFAQNDSHFARLLKSSMIETKTTLFLDGLGCLAALIGLASLALLGITHNNRFDGLGGMLTGLATASLALFIIHDARSLLVGRGATPEEMQAIRTAALGTEKVRTIEGLKTMHIGSTKLLVNLEVNLDPELKTRQIEEIMDLIKARIKQKIPDVAYIQVELESRRRGR